LPGHVASRRWTYWCLPRRLYISGLVVPFLSVPSSAAVEPSLWPPICHYFSIVLKFILHHRSPLPYAPPELTSVGYRCQDRPHGLFFSSNGPSTAVGPPPSAALSHAFLFYLTHVLASPCDANAHPPARLTRVSPDTPERRRDHRLTHLEPPSLVAASTIPSLTLLASTVSSW
jgi:hypothetical protein